MHNLREKLLSAGLVTEAQTAQAESFEKKKAQNGARGRRPGKTQPRPFVGSTGSAVDPKLAPALKAIDEHRIRGDVRGTEEFHFEERRGAVRKMLITKEIAHGLTSGRMAIVESGDQNRHVIVGAAAVSKIRAVDAQMVRSFNNDGVTS
jgi:uncharacterized protein YaiL (DUF2058 family)